MKEKLEKLTEVKRADELSGEASTMKTKLSTWPASLLSYVSLICFICITHLLHMYRSFETAEWPASLLTSAPGLALLT